MHVSNDDTWDVKITMQRVTFDHGSKRILLQSMNLRLVKKTFVIVLDLLKLTCPKKLKGFCYRCHFGVLPRFLVVPIGIFDWNGKTWCSGLVLAFFFCSSKPY